MDPTAEQRPHHPLRRLIEGLARPPVFDDEDQTLRAGLLNISLWTAIVITSLLTLSNLASGFAYAATLPVELSLLLIYLVLLWAMRRGHVGWAAYLYLMVGLLGISLALFILGSASLVISGVYLIAVMIAGLLLKERYAILTSLITAALVLGLLWAEYIGVLPPRTPVDPVTRSVTWVGLIFVTAGLVMLTRRHYLRLLERYRLELAERRRTEEALSYSQARLLGLVSAIPDYIFIFDSNGVYIDVFTPKTTGMAIEARRQTGRAIQDFCPPDETAAFLDVIRAALDAGPHAAPIEFEYALSVAADGSISYTPDALRRWYHASVVAYDSPEGRRVLWLAREITDARNTTHALQKLTADLEQRVQERTARLEEVNRELESFAYTVSHDLRAPLRALNGYARLLEEDYGANLPADAQDMLAMLRKGAARLSTQIDDLLHLADRPLQRRPLSMHALAQSAAECALAGCEPDRKVDIRIEDLPPANADPTLIERVLTNLLDNALKFTRPCPLAVVQVGAQQQNGSVVYFVADNGVGFEMSAAERLFAPFQRLHNEHDFEGSGLGLASARHIVERHGGRIWADSRPGSGATFYFTLPE